MSITSIENLLAELGLSGALESFRTFSGDPQKLSSTTMEVLLETILINERNMRESRRQEVMLRLAHLPLPAVESAVSYDEERGQLFKEHMLRALTLDFVDKGQNINIFGRAGSGKSYIATVLARKNCMRGNTTAYYSASDLVNDLKLVYGAPAYKAKRRTAINRSLLVLDDFCLTSFDNDGQAILFDLLDKRYGKRSTIIVSQKTPDLWLEVLGHSSLAESIIERASTNNFVITLKGDSRRKSLE